MMDEREFEYDLIGNTVVIYGFRCCGSATTDIAHNLKKIRKHILSETGIDITQKRALYWAEDEQCFHAIEWGDLARSGKLPIGESSYVGKVQLADALLAIGENEPLNYPSVSGNSPTTDEALAALNRFRICSSENVLALDIRKSFTTYIVDVILELPLNAMYGSVELTINNRSITWAKWSNRTSVPYLRDKIKARVNH